VAVAQRINRLLGDPANNSDCDDAAEAMKRVAASKRSEVAVIVAMRKLLNAVERREASQTLRADLLDSNGR